MNRKQLTTAAIFAVSGALFLSFPIALHAGAQADHAALGAAFEGAKLGPMTKDGLVLLDRRVELVSSRRKGDRWECDRPFDPFGRRDIHSHMGCRYTPPRQVSKYKESLTWKIVNREAYIAARAGSGGLVGALTGFGIGMLLCSVPAMFSALPWFAAIMTGTLLGGLMAEAGHGIGRRIGNKTGRNKPEIFTEITHKTRVTGPR